MFTAALVVPLRNEGRRADATLTALGTAVRAAATRGISTEVVLVLDRADEATREAARRAASRRGSLAAATVRLLELDLGDPGSARNRAIAATSAPVVGVVPADVMVCEGWIVDGLGVLRAQPGTTVVHPAVLVRYPVPRTVTVLRSSTAVDVPVYALAARDYWPGASLGHREAYVDQPAAETGGALDEETVGWHWNCETLAAGVPHLVVAETAQFVRLSTAGLSVTDDPRACLPPTALLRSASIAAQAPVDWLVDPSSERDVLATVAADALADLDVPAGDVAGAVDPLWAMQTLEAGVEELDLLSPRRFNAAHYRSLNPELGGLSYPALVRHYLSYGHEGGLRARFSAEEMEALETVQFDAVDYRSHLGAVSPVPAYVAVGHFLATRGRTTVPVNARALAARVAGQEVRDRYGQSTFGFTPILLAAWDQAAATAGEMPEPTTEHLQTFNWRSFGPDVEPTVVATARWAALRGLPAQADLLVVTDRPDAATRATVLELVRGTDSAVVVTTGRPHAELAAGVPAGTVILDLAALAQWHLMDAGGREDLLATVIVQAGARAVHVVGSEVGAAAVARYRRLIAAGGAEVVAPAGAQERGVEGERSLRVSVILPTYRGDAWVGGCLESVAAQTVPVGSYEIVVVQNGPPTRTPQIVADFAARHPGIQVQLIETETPGLSHARNLGLDAAQGEYVVFVDDDDRFGPQHLEALLSVAGPDAVGGTIVSFVDDGDFARPSLDNYITNGLLPFLGRRVAHHNLVTFLTYPWAKIVRTDLARKVRFDESLPIGEDVVFWAALVASDRLQLRLAEAGADAAYLYNVRPGSLMDHAAEHSWERDVERHLPVIAALEGITSDDPFIEWMVREAEERHWVGISGPYLTQHPEEYQRLAEEAARLNLRNVPWRALGCVEIPYVEPPGRVPVEVTEPRRHLALFRSGPTSLHPHAVARLERQNFDYCLSWFGADDPADLGMADGARFVHRVKGPKWPGVYATLVEYRDVVDRYDYVWLPDDDLMCVPEQVSEMFDIAAQLRLDLAQPALDPKSYFSYPITLRHPRFQVRWTSFVEVMAPLLSTPFLWKVLPTIEQNVTGWGLDFVWPTMTSIGKMAIIDETPVLHTRPVGGPNYAAAKQAGGRSPEEELEWTIRHYGIQHPWDHQIAYGGLLYNGDVAVLGPDARAATPLIRAVQGSWRPWESGTPQLERYLRNHVLVAEGQAPYGIPPAEVPAHMARALTEAGLLDGPQPVDG
jgi:glycosyltransferase involved in cell wall biosynthesis